MKNTEATKGTEMTKSVEVDVKIGEAVSIASLAQVRAVAQNPGYKVSTMQRARESNGVVTFTAFLIRKDER